MSVKFSRRHLFWAVPLAVLAIVGAGYAARMMGPPPADLDLALSKTTDHGLYVASLSADMSPVPVGAIHTWTVTVTTPDGTPVDRVAIAVDGGMPQHGHGLPTKPRVTQHAGNGEHVVDGMKFNMGGWWVVKFRVAGALGPDSVTFNLKL